MTTLIKSLVLSTIVTAVSVPGLRADTLTLDFQEVPVPGPGYFVDVTTYLASFGIVASNVTPGALFGVTVSDAVVPSTKHVLNEYNGVNPATFTLNFSSPKTSVSFVRQQYGPNNTGPAWEADAFDSLGRIVGKVSESYQFATPSATYTITGSDITALKFSSVNTGQTWSSPPIGSLTLTQTPEPATFVPAFGFLAVGLLWRTNVLRCWLRQSLNSATG